METIESILAFWFGADADVVSDPVVAQRQGKMWWSKADAIDRAIAQRFAVCTEQAATLQLQHWRATPHGWLALLILSDQFPRNMYRGTPRAFEYDAFALQTALDGIDLGIDRQLRPIQRVFFYLPLEHAESLAHQEHALQLFTSLAQEVPAAQQGAFAGFVDFARRHHDVVARFGRFPHRNVILGRLSSADEEAFLLQPGSSF